MLQCAPSARSIIAGPDALDESWAEAERALAAARDAALPPLARGAALARVSAIIDLQVGPRLGRGAPSMVLAARLRAHALVEEQYAAWAALAPALAAAGAPVPAPLEPNLAAAARAVFRRDVFPALTPVAVGPGYPSLRLANGAVEVAVLLASSGRRAGRLALVRIPAGLPRLVAIPGRAAPALLEELVAAHAAELFPGDAVAAAAAFRATLASAPAAGRARRASEVARIELAAAAPAPLAAALVDALRLAPPAVFFVPGPLRLQDLAAAAAHEPGNGRLAG